MTSVADFYAGKSIFITGCTGFVGKVLLEKILSSCPDVKKVYILLRGKRDLNVEQRLTQMLELPIFSRLKNENPMVLEKIVPIPGDVTQDKLGISPEDEQTLIHEVSVVFHVAATIKFNEPLHVALNVNVKGVERVLFLCKRMKKLQILVYVSTAYSNTHKSLIEEKIYPPPVPLSVVDKLIKEQPDEEETVKIIGDNPNTYTFSKALGESLVAEKHGHVPVAIVRPSIIGASLSQPMPGWIDNCNGATSLIAGVVKGIIRVLPGKGTNVVDLIPVDCVVNLIIVAATKKPLQNDVIVYTCGSSTEKPLKLKEITKYCLIIGHKYKLNELPFLDVVFTDNNFLLAFLSTVLETLPSVLADIVLRLWKQKPKYKKILVKIDQLRSVLTFFISNPLMFSTTNNFCLFTTLSTSDRNTFPFSPSLINWDEYMDIYIRGIDEHIFKKK